MMMVVCPEWLVHEQIPHKSDMDAGKVGQYLTYLVFGLCVFLIDCQRKLIFLDVYVIYCRFCLMFGSLGDSVRNSKASKWSVSCGF